MIVSTTTALLDRTYFDGDQTMEELLRRLIAAGFIGLDMNCGNGHVAYPEIHQKGYNWRKRCEELRRFVEDRDARFNQSHNLMFNYFDGTAETDVLNAWFDDVVEATKLLGGDIVVVHPIAPPGMEFDRAGALAANRDYFRRHGETAAKHGMKLAVENMLSNRLFDGGITKRCCTNSEELVELVDAIDMENVGICVDIGHMHYMQEDIGTGLKNCAHKLISLHIHDNDTFNDSHIPPYSGKLDWDTFYKTLREIDYRGDFTLEILNACKPLPYEQQMAALKQICTLSNWMAQQITCEGDIL